jgi:uncharacterized protein YkwD
MNLPRLLAAALLVLTFVGVALAISRIDAADETTSAAPLRQLTTTTEEPDFEVLVASGAIMALPAAEQHLTDEALSRSTSTTTTTTTTTTTLPPSTTTTAAATTTEAKKSSGKASPPPTTAPPTTAASGGFDSGAESEFASLINSYRGSQGAASLSRDGSLDSYARSWAKKLSANGGLSHSNIGSLIPPWSSVGENVAMGGSVGAMFDALVGSSGHRQNMLGDFTHFGVGVWRDADGTLWTAHVFTR